MAVKELDINERIRDREVRVIDANGDQLGIMSSYDANRIADEKDLDLVKISPNVVPPVCKIMDYGKYKFDLSKKEKDARRAQKTTDLKEVQLSMTIEQHDLDTKAKHAIKFLNEGDKVKCSIRMKGRQQAYPEQAFEVMRKFAERVGVVGVKDEKGAVKDGKNIIMILLPNKKLLSEKVAPEKTAPEKD